MNLQVSSGLKETAKRLKLLELVGTLTGHLFDRSIGAVYLNESKKDPGKLYSVTVVFNSADLRRAEE